MFTSSEHVSSCGRRSPNTRPGSVLLGSSGCRLLLFGCPTGCCLCRLFNRGCFFRNFTAKKQDTYATVTRGFSVIGQQGIKRGALTISGQGNSPVCARMRWLAVFSDLLDDNNVVHGALRCLSVCVSRRTAIRRPLPLLRRRRGEHRS